MNRQVPTLLLISLALAASPAAQGPLARFGVNTKPPEHFSQRVVASNLQDPWELRVAPDNSLWVTERTRRQITRVDPKTGDRKALVQIADAYARGSQDGVLGLAMHPGLMKGRGTDFVYVAFVYNAAQPPAEDLRRLAVRRYTYDSATGTLGSPIDLIRELPARDDHTGGRLAIGADLKLYLTIGDQAANHLGHHCDPNRAQDLPTAEDIARHDWTLYQGKILRLELDGSIPADNPLLNGVRSHIYTYGHRNPQGIAVAPDGKIYSSEHGPSTDDELNLILAGKNYGWPYVAGYRDDRGYVYANWSASLLRACKDLAFDPLVAPASVPQKKETAWNHPDFMPPLQTFFTVDSTFDFKTLGNATIAPSGIDVYRSAAIPGWANSVLMTSLKLGSVFRLKLSADGTAVEGAPIQYFKTDDRYRAVTVSADGLTIFVAMDTELSKDFPGSILAFEFGK